jgi:hypothetical protein
LGFGTNKHRLNTKQKTFFDDHPSWTDNWVDMPAHEHKNLEPWRSLQLHFRNDADLQEFARLLNQPVSPTTKYLWYPKAEIDHTFNKRVVFTFPKQPKYPVYVVTKGRADTRLTINSLEEMGVPYKAVVEPQEFDEYAAVIGKKNILKLPFSNLGKGSIPARNWIWNHARESGAARHWILDDNIRGFYRFENNRKIPLGDGTAFAIAENFVDRYENVALAGFQYNMFVVRKNGHIPPYYLNTRVYSCILVRNDLKYEWRGRYNEDTDLSLCALKDGFCTVLFTAFMANKMGTMTMKGGNTDQLYQGEGRLKMAEELMERHPDIVKVITRWGRPQHHVDYKIFSRNKLVRRKDAVGLSNEELASTVKPIDIPRGGVYRKDAEAKRPAKPRKSAASDDE